MGLLAACSQEDLNGPMKAGGESVVSATVNVPGTGVSRAVPANPDGYQLRCILEVWDADEQTRLTRQEALPEGGQFSFQFSVDDDVNYRCYFWADFVDAGASANESGNYPDKYYTTNTAEGLTNVAVIAQNGLFNNDACDAFFGVVEEQENVYDINATLTRPFAKLTVSDKVEGKVADCTNLEVSYSVPTNFNVFTGECTGTQLISYSGLPADAETDAWFYNYVFAPVNANTLESDINMNITTASGTHETVISAEKNNIPLQRNYLINVTGNMTSTVNVTVDIDSEFIDPNAPQPLPEPVAGDFFYTDGTWSASLDEDKTVAGVIFAVGDAVSADAVSNYSGIEGASAVKAWVVASDDAGSGIRFLEQDQTAALPEGAGSGQDDILGCKNTALWYAQNQTAYLAVNASLNWNVEVTGGINSGWYLPSAGQMLELVSVYAENAGNAQGEALAVQTSLQTLADVGKGSLMGSGYYWTSTGGMSGDNVGVYRVGFHTADNYAKCGLNNNITNGSYVRPVLTIFAEE